MDYTLTISQSSMLTVMTSSGNVTFHVSSSAVVSLPLIGIRMGNDDAWTTGMNQESISLKQDAKRNMSRPGPLI